jgi:hypothetical protein
MQITNHQVRIQQLGDQRTELRKILYWNFLKIVDQILVSLKSEKNIINFKSTTCVYLRVSWYFAVCEETTRNTVDVNGNNMSQAGNWGKNNKQYRTIHCFFLHYNLHTQ